MTRRALIACAALALLAAGSPATAAAPPGPRLAFVEYSRKPFRLELKSVDATGGQAQRIAGGAGNGRPWPVPLEPPHWSTDGSLIAFDGVFGRAGGAADGEAKSQIYVSRPDGSGLRAIPGTAGGLRPVFSPDGQTIAFERRRERLRGAGGRIPSYESVSIWMANLRDGRSRRLTPWRNGLEMVADSFSPDGSTLAVSRQDTSKPVRSEALLLSLDGGGATVLALEAQDPVYSPDGSELAFLGLRESEIELPRGNGPKAVPAITTDLYTTTPAGTDTKQLTNTPKAIEAWPSWDPSGNRLAFTRLPGRGLASVGGALGFGDAIVEVNADGTCPTKILSVPGVALYGAAWEPGPGREAGPISC